jgi:hypothetical protein
MYALAILSISHLVSAFTIGAKDETLRAAYFLDNNPSGSSIISLKIASNGTLADPIRTSTGGIGMLGLSAGPNATAPAAGSAGNIDRRPWLYTYSLLTRHLILPGRSALEA